MKKILGLFITFVIVMIMAGCDDAPLPVKTTPCLEVGDVNFYASTVDGILGTKDIIMLETPYGDVEVKESVYDKALLDVYSHVCINVVDDVATGFASGRLIDLAVPEPPTVEVIVEVPVIEYVDREVEVEVEVQTHAEINPDLWISMNHSTYFYYVQENVVHLVYNGEMDSYMITILFEPSFAFSDKVMVASMIHLVSGIYQGARTIDTSFVDTEFGTIEQFVDNFIVTHTLSDVELMFSPSGGN